MPVLLFALTLAQVAPCEAVSEAMAAAEARLDSFDSSGALERLAASQATGCAEVQIALTYLRGLAAARDAYPFGGSFESLEPVREAIAALDSFAEASASAEIAQVVLRAASAAAQSEREEMSLLLAHALALERQRRSVGERGAPLVSAQEVAGDLWLQVHRFEEARESYRRAAAQVGLTRRVRLGLARSAARLSEVDTACHEYGMLVNEWDGTETPAEIHEARAHVAESFCATAAGPLRR
jgi:hypothetical protein